MKPITLKVLASFFASIQFFNIAAQQNKLMVGIDIPVQYEKQHALIPVGAPRTVNGKAINFGIDLFLRKNLNEFSFQAGVGYFRDRINLKRPYNHQLLNLERDSLPIQTSTKNYTYDIFRIPLRIAYCVNGNSKMKVFIGADHFFNFTFSRYYNGPKPFPGANNKAKTFNYYGNSVNIFLSFECNSSKQNKIAIEPFARVINNYKSDKYLFENGSSSFSKHLDAFGIAIKYSLGL